jgi:hypothetical protein
MGTLTTRTQGFWATHMALTKAVWYGGTVGGHSYLGGLTFGGVYLTPQQLMGGFWASISQLSNPNLKGKAAQRTDLNKARMQLLQQLLAAICNNAAFGSAPSSGTSIDQAIQYFFTGTKTQVQTAARDMGAFNQSGELGLFTPGVSSDGGKVSKGFAATNGGIAYWDALPPGNRGIFVVLITDKISPTISFTAGPSPLSNFNLDTDPLTGLSYYKAFTSVTNGSYTVSLPSLPGWTITDILPIKAALSTDSFTIADPAVIITIGGAAPFGGVTIFYTLSGP